MAKKDNPIYKGQTPGVISKDEEIKILELLPTHTNEQIAEIFGRTPTKIKQIRATAGARQAEIQYRDIIEALKLKFFWQETVAQLLSNEVEYFEKYWASLFHQFTNTGIVATDELMMRDLILLDIHLNRTNKTKKAVAEEMQALDDSIIKVLHETQDDLVSRSIQLQPLQDRQNALRTASKSLNEEGKNIQEKKDKKYEQLKSTREMRLEKAEKAGTSFYELVRSLDTPEMRQEVGRLTELHKIAAGIAKLEFNKLHKYGNNTHDNPILTPESVLEEQASE